MSTPHSFAPAVPIHTYQRIVEQIEHAIVSGEIPVGAQLASERELMVQFDVSRPTVREALRVLQSMGLIESKPGTRGGPQVLAPSPDTLRRSLRAMLGTAALDLAELVQYRVVLEGSASALAALQHSDAQREEMRAAVEGMQAAAEANAEEFADLDLAFHTLVWNASGNRIFALSGEAVSGVLRGLMHRDAEGIHHDNRVKLESAAIDRGLFDAIARRDAVEAGTIARRAVANRFGPLLEPGQQEALALLAG
ncbi:GntR family transcriptional regulator [Leucobacter sp. OLJS4]|uniref:FadR/GntR family transcriptional regulator n=2 Tax=Leucobacter TaxID=55968 RepID=UPI000C1849C9|nr:MULTISPECIES: GntR family transcriptional regulator [unclassified Leucobacter]PII85513.1 GntR family transcriptional regulator [Leucobacter sp. OLCALW19]PII91684.1 GntR family transcriptional regulator [Leucobacter sp. OLTLW20]PII91731.1 GntR family transcriptional regulator [Leucobacter sp. OLAS13]PIJ00052.1 GntR family transcriptional regulator [Leucobacter sp. OLDS2]PIJ04263.1 GntR family transcriptional regulator [Leucobacter sp. OLIS6]